MRTRTIALGTCHHIVLRGARGVPYLHESTDWWHCLQLLYYLNDSHSIRNWKRVVAKQKQGPFFWPKHWPIRDPITSILAFALHNNHLHLILKETREGGIPQFMQRLGDSLSRSTNQKYGGSGTLFQGTYKNRIIETDADMRNVGLYLMAKNVLERYPDGGIKGAYADLANAIEWAKEDSFSSFPDYACDRDSPILEPEILNDVYTDSDHFVQEARNYVLHYSKRERLLGDLALE